MLTDSILDAAAELCDGRLVLCHEGGYSSAYVPYCGLAIVERLAASRPAWPTRGSTTTARSPRSRCARTNPRPWTPPRG